MCVIAACKVTTRFIHRMLYTAPVSLLLIIIIWENPFRRLSIWTGEILRYLPPLCFVLKTNSWVFSVFILTTFCCLLVQTAVFSSAGVLLHSKPTVVFPEIIIEASPACKNASLSIGLDGRSVMWVINSSEPKIETCGMPWDTFCVLDISACCCRYRTLFVNYDSIRL